MNLAKISNGAITEYPLSAESYEQAVENGLEFPFAAEKLIELGLVDVVVEQRPIVDAYDYIPQPPQLVDGVWHVTWTKDLDTPEDVLAVRTLNLSNSMRATRDLLIKEIQWRFERYARLARLNKPQVDNIADLDAYVQDLTEVPEQAGFPFNITWPEKAVGGNA